MYVRARPYANIEILKKIIENKDIDQHLKRHDNELYFDSGSSALKWFLIQQSKKINKKLNVGIQVLTCITVRDAIEKSKNIPIFLDIDYNYLTTLLEQLNNYKDKLDVLILTHLYGIVNPEYEKIKEWCENNNIVLIDDLAQNVDGKIENYSDYYFYSFAFDKPLSSGFGGMLKIKDDDEYLKKSYEELEELPNNVYLYNVKKFYLYYLCTGEEIYRKEFRRNSILEKFIIKFLRLNFIEKNKILIYKILSSKLNYIIAKLGRLILKKKNIKIYRIADNQLGYFLYIKSNKDSILKQYKLAFNEMIKKIKKIFNINVDNSLYISYGQRASLVVENIDEVIKKLKHLKIEAGNYNWSSLICDKTEEKKFPNALKVVKKIINIPIWKVEIWKN